MSRLKVLFIVNVPAPYRVDFFTELGKFCDLTVLFEKQSSSERDRSWFGSDYLNFDAVFLDRVRNPALALIRHIRSVYDVVIVGGYATPAGMLAINYLMLRRIPFGLNADGAFINHGEHITKFLIKRHHIARAAFWLSSGDITSEYLQYYGAQRSRIHCYPFTSLLSSDILQQPIDPKEKQRLRRELGMVGERVILSVGSIIPRKGFDVLLEACRSLPKSYGVYIVGGEPTLSLKKVKEKHNLENVQFVSFKDKLSLKKYYSASDLFVLPTREDIWGLVVNEAMAHGLPVITTDKCIAGLELIVQDKNGFIVPVDNPEALAEKIEMVLGDKFLLEKMIHGSLEQIRDYTIENMALRTMEILENRTRRIQKAYCPR